MMAAMVMAAAIKCLTIGTLCCAAEVAEGWSMDVENAADGLDLLERVDRVDLVGDLCEAGFVTTATGGVVHLFQWS